MSSLEAKRVSEQVCCVEQLVVADLDLGRATKAAKPGAKTLTRWEDAIQDERVRIVSIATTNNLLPVVARRALAIVVAIGCFRHCVRRTSGSRSMAVRQFPDEPREPESGVRDHLF